MCKATFVYIFMLCPFFYNLALAQSPTHVDVIVIGGGASGTAAGLAAARLGARTLILEEGPWLGGMLTSAGVSAFDGNHKLAGGIFAEFRDSLYRHYGGPKAVETGWVSNTLFEPSAGARIFHNMASREPKLAVSLNTKLSQLVFRSGKWQLSVLRHDSLMQFTSDIVIDATELGDLVEKLGIPADIGMDSGPETGEMYAPAQSNDIVQDLTWVAILKEYKAGEDHLLPRPAGYEPEKFRCCCDTRDPSTKGQPLLDCQKMLEYGRLPNGKYMINWPNCGNDLYLNVLRMSPAERASALQKAKDHTLKFVYFLQNELGFTHLGLANDEFPTVDKLPIIPYHRESRRVKGKARLLVNHILHPYDQKEAWYRTGIAVGDYPIDHHHKQNPEAPAIDFINIKAPSYNLPLGSLLPQSDLPLVVAEKSISVSNIVNGASRLQPVVLGIGQAAGTLAALASLKKLAPDKVSIREIQQSLLDQGAYIMPYIDVPPSDPDFQPIQRIGASGLLRGKGIPYKWANQTWFYPDSLCRMADLIEGMRVFGIDVNPKNGKEEEIVTIGSFTEIVKVSSEEVKTNAIIDLLKKNDPFLPWTNTSPLSRRHVSFLLDIVLRPFSRSIDLNGHLQQIKNHSK